MTRKINLAAGPSMMNEEILKLTAEAVLDYDDSGISIMELNHRTTSFSDIVHESITLIRELLHIDNKFEVLWLQGGATLQFSQIPMNFLNEGETAAYIDTSVWSEKPISDAVLFGNAKVIASSKDKNYNYIPKDFDIPHNANYLHITANNTAEGTQWHHYPKTHVPLVIDMTSNMFTEPIDPHTTGIVYGSAQKTFGTAGNCLTIIRNDMFKHTKRSLPYYLDYRNHVKAKSILNTIPVMNIYVSLVALRWIKKNGGVVAMQKLYKERAEIIYNALDTCPIFTCETNKEDRSHINFVFKTAHSDMDQKFIATCKEHNIVGVAGYSSRKGIRISTYNAVTIDQAKKIASIIKTFQKDNG